MLRGRGGVAGEISSEAMRRAERPIVPRLMRVVLGCERRNSLLLLGAIAFARFGVCESITPESFETGGFDEFQVDEFGFPHGAPVRTVAIPSDGQSLVGLVGSSVVSWDLDGRGSRVLHTSSANLTNLVVTETHHDKAQTTFITLVSVIPHPHVSLR
jgi:hypothetical protein